MRRIDTETPASAGVTLRGIPLPEYTVHTVRASAGGDTGSRNEARVEIAVESPSTAAGVSLTIGGMGLELTATTDDSVVFQAPVASVRALAGALLGALAEAERRGLVAPAAAVLLRMEDRA